MIKDVTPYRFRFGVGALALVIIIAGLAYFLWITPEHQLRAANLCPREYLEADNRIRVTILTAVGGLIGILGVTLNWRQIQENRGVALVNRELALKTQILTERGQITTRFKESVALLGALELPVRVGAILALGRVQADSQEAMRPRHEPSPDYWPILDLLVLFLQSNATIEGKSSGSKLEENALEIKFENAERLRPDLQAALNVIGRRTEIFGRNYDSPVDLAALNLRFAFLVQGHFEGAFLDGADLTHSWMADAHFECADFGSANLSECDMVRCALQGARMASVRGLSQQQVDSSIGDHKTTLPAGIERPESWIGK